ncbi:hypothetical protein A4X13_0g5297 [Tilletia indica]|uniref:Uncharacterized protein n=1 Tax=Tilletia indica TaxID=43049 RepID=A0A8T8SVT7_9BASI|nr:hypothetical protein A4X13_0g5297 [Tilletia indica]
MADIATTLRAMSSQDDGLGDALAELLERDSDHLEEDELASIVTNVSQRIAELDKARAQVPGEEADVFSQDDQLEQSSTVAKQVELSVAVTLPSSTNEAKGKSAKPISKDSMIRCAKDTEFTVFKGKVVASALNAGLFASTYNDLDIEGKIAAGGVWKDNKRLHDDDAFRSFWEKILKKKPWEAYVYVSQSPTAVIEVSSDSGADVAPVKVEDDSTDDDEVAKAHLAAAASDAKKKRKSDEAPTISGKRPKIPKVSGGSPSPACMHKAWIEGLLHSARWSPSSCRQ